ncbi:MAG: hypothetical protein GEU75_12795 [Dehalococcoidia bacterium]|nr:hypothetical protein [Dehalococcoidia bacterium]
METLEKLGHAALFLSEAVLVIALFWACDSALRPDAVRVLNDTRRSVTLQNCEYSLGSTNPVVLNPGETRSIHAVRACQVHAPEYAGCLSFPDEAYESRAMARVSRMSTYTSLEACSDSGARQRPRTDAPGRN